MDGHFSADLTDFQVQIFSPFSTGEVSNTKLAFVAEPFPLLSFPWLLLCARLESPAKNERGIMFVLWFLCPSLLPMNIPNSSSVLSALFVSTAAVTV